MINLDINEIMKTIPHRYPFLLIDRVLNLRDEMYAEAIKNVSINEHFFQGHFPGQPVMPGVLIVEALAQLGAVLAMRWKQAEGMVVYFGGIDNVRFKRPVVPGDQLTLIADVQWVRRGIGKMIGTAKVGDEIAATGELMFSLVPQGTGGAQIHPTSTIDATAKIGKNVKIGPYVFIGRDVEIGEGTKIDAYASVARWTKIGKNNHIYHNATIGGNPQDFKYKGEKSEIIIGDRNIFREYVSVHLPTGAGEKTIVGNENYLMIHSHVPHNCLIGDHVVIGAYVGLAGHTILEDQVILGGLAGIHQFVRIGKLAMIGGMTRVVQDIPPFMLAEGNPVQLRGINMIGLARKGYSKESMSELKKAFKLLIELKSRTKDEIIAELKSRLRPLEEINYLINFIEQDSKRGVSKKFSLEEEEEDLIFPEIPELGI